MAQHGRSFVNRNPSLSRTFSAQAITLNADSGIFILAGTDVADHVVRITGPGPIGIPITEREPSEPFSAQIVATGGAFAVSGTAASLKRGLIFSSESGVFSETGTVASLEIGYKVSATAGAYSLAGTAASLKRGVEVAADAGEAVTVTGSDATLTVSSAITLDAESGDFAVTGTAATLERARLFDAESGAFVVAGSDAALKKGGLELAADSGFFSVLGTAVDFSRDLVVVAASGSVAVTGSDASLERSGIELVADSGSFAVTGTAATFHRPSTAMAAGSGTFTATGLSAYLDHRALVSHLINVSPKIYVRRPPSVVAEGAVEFGTGGTPYGEIQHPIVGRAYVIVNTGMVVINIEDRSAPSVVGVVTDAIGNMANESLDSMAFDSTGRYLYATTAGIHLFTYDLGAGFVNKDDPPIVSAEADVSNGDNLNVMKRIGSSLYLLTDVATNNSFQKYDISTPSNPSLVSTTAMTGVDIEALAGHVSADETLILYPASDTSGKILAVPVATPASFSVLQLPTVGGNQIRCTSGIVFSDDQHMVLHAFFVSGSLRQHFWMVYDISMGATPTTVHCTSETITNGAIANLKAPYISSAPQHAQFSGHYWNDGSDVLHLGVVVRDDSFGAVAELRFYAWLDYDRVPRFSGACSLPGTYSVQAANAGAAKNEWLSVGISADRSNSVLSLATSDLIKLVPNYVADWFEVTDALTVGQRLRTGMSGEDHVARTGTFEFEVDNSELNNYLNLGGYSPDSQSPITADLQVGSSVIWVVNGAIRFSGLVESIRPEPGRWEDRTVRVTCTDGMEILHVKNVERLPILSNVTTDEAIKTLFDRIPYLTGTETLLADPDTATHEYVNDRAYDEKTKAIGVINQLVESSQGFFYQQYIGGTGGMVYRSLDSYKKAALRPILLDTKFHDMEIARGVSEIYNSITVRYYPRRVDTGQNTVLFTMQQRIRIKAGKTIQLDAQYRDPAGLASRVGGIDMIYPVVATDYTLRSQKTGGGTNLNAQLSLSAKFGATGAKIIAANDGPLAGWFKTQLRGNGVYTQEPNSVTERDTDSISKYQLRELIIDAQYLSTEQEARLLAEAHLVAHKDPRSFVTRVKFDIDNSGAPVAAATSGPTGKVGVQETVTGLTASDWWSIGTGKLGVATSSESAKLYGLDVHSIQQTTVEIQSQGITQCTLDLIPEKSIIRSSSWIDPTVWLDDDVAFNTLFNLHLYDDIRALWHDKQSQTADVAKSDTTFAALTGMNFGVLAGDTWDFLGVLFFVSNATANVKVTVVGLDANGVDASSLLSGRFGLWGNSNPITAGNSPTFGGIINMNVVGAGEEVAVISGRVSSPIDATIAVYGAQQSASGTTTFREHSMILPFLIDRSD